MVVSKIEIAKQRTELAPSLTLEDLKRRKRELDLKIKYFENDSNYEKFKQNAEIQKLLKKRYLRRLKRVQAFLNGNTCGQTVKFGMLKFI